MRKYHVWTNHGKKETVQASGFVMAEGLLEAYKRGRNYRS